MLSLTVYETSVKSKLVRESLQSGFILRIMDETAIALVETHRGAQKGKELKGCFKNGAIGIAIYQDETIAAYGWIGYNRESLPQRKYTVFTIPGNSAHIFGCYTFLPFRGKGLYKQVVGSLVDQAYKDALTQVYIDTVIGNVPAEKAVNKMGFDMISKQYKLFFWNKIIYEFERPKK
ncbi:MAG: GNAT superfamily N-acetyltransferase [Crocinitomicaceae bacterium]|jgi:GNAT superfamily N-acetyltransferase